MSRILRAPFAVLLLLSSAGFWTGCETIKNESAIKTDTNGTPPPTRSIKSYMAEMEQYLNDVYRFYDVADMHSTLIERIDLVIAFHDKYIELDPNMFESIPESQRAEMTKLYKFHTLKSKRLFVELKQAIQSKEYDKVKSILDELDLNRRDSHTIFG